jgi:hypothetical protein
MHKLEPALQGFLKKVPPFTPVRQGGLAIGRVIAIEKNSAPVADRQARQMPGGG